MYTKEDFQRGIEICQMFIDLYETITSSIKEYLSVLEEAKMEEIRNLILSRDNISTDMEQRLIKKRYYNHEYVEFVKIVSNKPDLLDAAVHQVKKVISRKKDYEIFVACGFGLNKDFSLDAKYFYVNYKMAVIKINELKANLAIKL